MRLNVDALMRKVRPSDQEGWSESAEGRQVLERILESDRDSAETPVPVSTRSPRWMALAVVMTAAATVAVLAGPRLLGGTGGDTDRAGQEAALDTYHAADAEFYRHLQWRGAAVLEVEQYRTLGEAAKAASAVVIADVTDVRPTRVITGEVNSDRVHMIGVVIRPVEVLRGDLPERFGQELTVEFLAGSADPGPAIDAMRSTMAQGRAVWFLRAKAESAEREELLENQGRDLPANEAEVMAADQKCYRLISSQGLLVQGNRHVVNPVANPEERSPVVAEAETYEKLSRLAADLRTAA